MGCDIHMFLEYRNRGCPWQADENHKPTIEDTCYTVLKEDEDDWCDACKNKDLRNCENAYRHYNRIGATDRDYQLFALLASVRGNGPREARGIPSDVSPTIKAAAEADCDGHSHSYISLEEFKKVLFEEYQDNEYGGYEPTDRDDIFYRWQDYSGDEFNKRPPDFSSIVTYGEMLKKKHNVENMIFDDESLNDVEVRLVFWFDN